MSTLLQDLRYGLRMLAKNPGFTAVVVLSLALGIGANTTIFSFVNALLFRPPAVESTGRLLELWERNTKGSGLGEYMPLSYPGYVYYRDHNHAFSGLLAFDGEMRPVSWGRSATGGRPLGGSFPEAKVACSYKPSATTPLLLITQLRSRCRNTSS